MTDLETAASPPPRRFVAAGAAAGGVSVIVFTIVHHLTISNIWSMFVAMLIMGALTGMSLAWNYHALVDTPSVRGWFAFNAMHVGLLTVLMLLSFALFDPVMPMVEVVNSTDGLPPELASRALPLVLVFSMLSAVVIQAVFGTQWRTLPATLLSTVVLDLLLGLNLAAAGLVEIPRDSLYLLAEFLGLVVLIAATYAATAAMGWRWSRG